MISLSSPVAPRTTSFSLATHKTSVHSLGAPRTGRVRVRAAVAAAAATAPAPTVYEVLSIPETARPEEIKAAYRRAARQWHPDVCCSTGADERACTERFMLAREAYELLSDPERRRGYDLALQGGFGSSTFGDTQVRAERGGFADWEAQLEELLWQSTARAASGEETWGSRMRHAHG